MAPATLDVSGDDVCVTLNTEKLSPEEVPAPADTCALWLDDPRKRAARHPRHHHQRLFASSAVSHTLVIATAPVPCWSVGHHIFEIGKGADILQPCTVPGQSCNASLPAYRSG